MDTLPIPLPRSLTAFCTHAANSEQISELIAELALRGPVTVLDGGNCFPAYRLLRLLRLRVQDPTEMAKRVFVRRAFTCYQIVALLEGTPALPQPYLLLDPFATFYDEQIPLPEVRRLLEGCLRQLERLCRSAPVLVALRPTRSEERAFLVEQVCAVADTLFATELLVHPISQPVLF
jgi:hypothetical protein